MAKYRNDLGVIDAVQWQGKNWEEVEEFMGIEVAGKDLLGMDCKYKFAILAPEGKIASEVDEGGYVVKDAQGEFRLCEQDVFEDEYEKVE